MRTNNLHTKPQLVSGRAEVFTPRPPPHKALGFFVVVLPMIPCGPRLSGPLLWLLTHMVYLGFPGSSAGKESSCNAGDPGVIPGWGSSPGEGIGCQLQISWASLVAQMVKKRIGLQCGRCGFNPWVGKIPWRRAWQPTPVFLPGESRGQRGLEGCSPRGHKESATTEQQHGMVCVSTQGTHLRIKQLFWGCEWKGIRFLVCLETWYSVAFITHAAWCTEELREYLWN